MIHWISLIAQTTAPSNPRPGPGGTGNFMFLALMMGFIAFIFLTARSQKKREKRERENLYARLAKNDRVLTAGGAIGTIISVKDNEVVLKVDESTNTKMTFLKSSIQRILGEDQDAPAGKG